MRIEITTQGVDLTDVTRSHVKRHLYFTLSRYSGRVKTVHVRLSDENGPKGGVDKRCRILVRLFGLPTVSVKQAAADLVTAVNVAADRAGRTVARRIGVALLSGSYVVGDEKKVKNREKERRRPRWR